MVLSVWPKFRWSEEGSVEVWLLWNTMWKLVWHLKVNMVYRCYWTVQRHRQDKNLKLLQTRVFTRDTCKHPSKNGYVGVWVCFCPFKLWICRFSGVCLLWRMCRCAWMRGGCGGATKADVMLYFMIIRRVICCGCGLWAGLQGDVWWYSSCYWIVLWASWWEARWIFSKSGVYVCRASEGELDVVFLRCSDWFPRQVARMTCVFGAAFAFDVVVNCGVHSLGAGGAS